MADIDQVARTVLPSILDDRSTVDRTLNELRVIFSLLSAMRGNDSVHASLGVHPDGDVGAAFSVFSLSVTRTEIRSPALAAAQSALAIAKSPVWRTNTTRHLQLPIGMSATLVAGFLSAPPAELLAGAGIDASTCEVFQARLAVPFPTNRHIAVADLTSAAIRHAESYTDIVEGIAQTMTFESPAQSTVSSRPPSRILELLQ
ncbi:hypothetical protein ABZ208_01500 [Streptomyces sp. NPDC006208]|uniref:hypothetical protein n=1 Tax=Streptomyces sp. NPDC006208 TaxID=3156734 RepID=UPI0033B5E419